MLDDTKDYSCGMTMQDGGIADTTLYNGKVYGFCATGCKEAFLKDPEALLKK
jgi:YHS domain-containing protein